MAAENSFDIACKIDMQEVTNALDQTRREIETRYDLKGTRNEVALEKTDIVLTAPDDMKLNAVADILQSMGILPSRTSDVEAYKDALGRPFLEGYVSTLANAQGFPIVLGGQEFSEALQQVIEQLQYGQVTAEEAQANAQADAASILERAAQ